MDAKGRRKVIADMLAELQRDMMAAVSLSYPAYA
jgi:hypothetical protein